MFTLTKSATYWWPVIVTQPSQDEPGKLVDAGGFEVQFAYLSNSANQALLDDVRANAIDDVAVVPRIVTGFRAVEDEAGQPLAFSADALGKLTDIPGVATAVVRAYFASRAAPAV